MQAPVFVVFCVFFLQSYHRSLQNAGEEWEGNKKVVKDLEAAHMKAAKIILGCSKRTSNAAVRAELGIQSLRSVRDARKLTYAVSHVRDDRGEVADNCMGGEVGKQ
ncbi:unnamed protein product [Ectocarpus sp. 13 AM-2016]